MQELEPYYPISAFKVQQAKNWITGFNFHLRYISDISAHLTMEENLAA